MRASRNILITAFLTLFIFIAASYTACNKNKCHNVTCVSRGVCDGGKCVCPVGFEGSRCEKLMRDKFIFNYNGYDSCHSFYGDTMKPYSVKLIAVLHDSLEMTLTNLLGDPSDSANCTIQSTDSFTFIGSNNSTTYTGWGKLRNDSLWLAFHVQENINSYDCKYFGQSLR